MRWLFDLPNIYIYIYIYMCVCVCVCARVCVHVYINIYIYIFVWVCVCVCVWLKPTKKAVNCNFYLVFKSHILDICGVMVNMLDCDIVVNKFDLQLPSLSN